MLYHWPLSASRPGHFNNYLQQTIKELRSDPPRDHSDGDLVQDNLKFICLTRHAPNRTPGKNHNWILGRAYMKDASLLETHQ